MCGIVGFVNFDKTVEQDRKKWIANAILVDQLRGIDSTGIALLPKQYSNDTIPALRSYKKALSAADFLQLGTSQSIINDAPNCRFVMGHNRFATTGDKSNDNYAHPFCYKEITAVHNGTLTDRTGLRHNHDVDSAAITMQLGDINPDKYTNLLAELRGAYTLVWYNAANNHVYLVRNDKRPLYLAKGYEGDTLFFASEEWMITWLMDRININALDLNKEGLTDIWEMPVDTLHSIDLSAADYNITTETYKSYEAPVTNSVTYHQQNINTINSEYIWDDALASSKKKPPKSLPAPNTGAASTCPYKVGESLFADSWEYIQLASNSRKGGKIEGISSEYPDVMFVAPNITKSKYDKLQKEWMEWKDAIEDSPDPHGDIPSDLEEIFLVGEVTCTSNLKNKDKWIVNLKPKSLSIEFIVTAIEEQIEDIEDTETPPEKQPEAPIYTDGERGHIIPSKSYSIGDKGVSLDEWLVAVNGGCDYCTLGIYVKDHDKIVWKSYIDKGKEEIVPICESCSEFLFTIKDTEVGQ